MPGCTTSLPATFRSARRKAPARVQRSFRSARQAEPGLQFHRDRRRRYPLDRSDRRAQAGQAKRPPGALPETGWRKQAVPVHFRRIEKPPGPRHVRRRRLVRHSDSLSFERYRIGLRNLNILFIAAKWDVVQNEYKSDRQYFRTNFPQTRSTVLSSPRIKARYLPFSVGEVVLEKRESGESVARLKSIEKRYVEFLISWIYHSFTQRQLKGYPRVNLRLWDRIKNFFAAW